MAKLLARSKTNRSPRQLQHFRNIYFMRYRNPKKSERPRCPTYLPLQRRQCRAPVEWSRDLRGPLTGRCKGCNLFGLPAIEVEPEPAIEVEPEPAIEVEPEPAIEVEPEPWDLI
jgi:hypothetical protein